MSSSRALAIALALLGAVISPRLVSAQEDVPRPQVRALRVVDGVIDLDGRLDEPAWSAAETAADFLQRQPIPGEAATQRTEVRILRDRKNLYIGLRAFDTDPRAIIAQEMRRDGGGGGGAGSFGTAGGAYRNDDSFVVVLDTFLDRRSAFYFETNPTGARADGLVENEGNANFEWNGVWTAAAKRDEHGWTAELVIPFSTLRFDPSTDVWGMQLRRLIRRSNEEVFWAPVGLDADVSRVSLAGSLLGMDDLPKSLNLRVKPFGSATSTQHYDETGGSTTATGGLDLLRWGITNNMTLDLTANTDFAQVEVDEQQVNLTRFSLFFPEKREFFLENAGIFEFGLPNSGAGRMRPPLLKMFFSRRIGLDDARVVPLNVGGRITGRTEGWDFGAIDVQTGSLDATDPEDPDQLPVSPTNWGVLRVKRKIGQRSTVGAIYTNKQVSGGDWNRVLGFDADINPSRRLNFTGFVAGSRDMGTSDTGFSGGAGFAWRGSIWRANAEYQDVRADFNPEMGFLLRDGVRRAFQSVEFEPRPDLGPAIRNLTFNVRTDVVWRTDGTLDTLEATVRLFGVDFNSGERVTVFGSHNYERLDEPFEIQTGVFVAPGEYSFDDVGLFGRTDGSRPVAGTIFWTYGDFYDGTRWMGNTSLTVRPNRFFSADTDWSFNDVNLPQARFTTNVIRQRLNIAFTPDLFWNTFVQYNSADELMSVNSRFNWIYRPGTDLFLVYNHQWQTGDGLVPADRSIILKATYLLAF